MLKFFEYRLCYIVARICPIRNCLIRDLTATTRILGEIKVYINYSSLTAVDFHGKTDERLLHCRKAIDSNALSLQQFCRKIVHRRSAFGETHLGDCLAIWVQRVSVYVGFLFLRNFILRMLVACYGDSRTPNQKQHKNDECQVHKSQ